MTLLAEPSPSSTGTSNRPMHIVHAVLSLDVGGLERVVLNLADQARETGHRVSVLCLERDGFLGRQLQDSGRTPIVLGKQPGLTPGLVKKIRGVLTELRPDVLHTHQIGALLYAGCAARKTDVPAIVHTEHINNIAKATVVSRRWRMGLLWRIAGRYADRFCCVSQDIAKAAAPHVPRRKLCVIENGIPISRFDRSNHRQEVRLSLGIPADAPVIGVVARLSEEKSLDLLIGAFASVRMKHPTAHLLLVGDGPCKTRLMQQADASGAGAFIHFAGYQAQPQRYLEAMDLFALTSRVEGMPLAILEAWAARLPVIASAVGGIPNLIEDRIDGILFQSGDLSALQACLCRVLENKGFAAQLGSAGRRRVDSSFSAARMADEYQQQYLQVIDQK